MNDTSPATFGVDADIPSGVPEFGGVLPLLCSSVCVCDPLCGSADFCA